MPKICEKCDMKLGIRKKKVMLKDFNGNKHFFCVNCYINKLNPSEKRKLIYKGETLGKTKLEPTGFVFGLSGGFGYSSGYASGVRLGIVHKLKKKGIDEKQIDKKSIDMFNVHFGALDEKGMNAVEKEILRK